MPLYHCRVIDQAGKKRTLSIEAPAIKEAKIQVREQGVLLLSLTTKKNWSVGRKKGELKAKDLLLFTTQLAQLLDSGMPLFESLMVLCEQYQGEGFYKIFHILTEKIKGGLSMSEACKTFPKSFAPFYCEMVAAGESIGLLPETLKKLSTLLKKRAKLRKQIVSALTYPAVLASFSFIVIFALLLFVIPSIETLFEGQQTAKLTTFVIAFSRLLRFHAPLLLSGVAALIAAGIYVFKNQKIRRWMVEKLITFPFLKKTIITPSLARFSRTLATLLDGGVNLTEALCLSKNVMQAPILEEIIEKASAKIVEGSRLSIQLKQSPLIPSIMTRMLAIGEESGGLAPMVHKIADLFEDEVEKTLSKITALAQPVILVVMGAFVGLIMLAVLLPLTDVSAFL